MEVNVQLLTSTFILLISTLLFPVRGSWNHRACFLVKGDIFQSKEKLDILPLATISISVIKKALLGFHYNCHMCICHVSTCESISVKL